ncbi:hypothetical protein [Streptomyces sp. CA-106110]|uniref:hypothetical protein n=1 Tax=Streptomyces sp. CA-106110 TaxID=3240044 RepID=UPI003D8C6505
MAQARVRSASSWASGTTTSKRSPRCSTRWTTGDDLDLTRIAAAGVSLGGYYALRSAAFDPRVTTVLANCGLWSV